jgi:hypothetical protein
MNVLANFNKYLIIGINSIDHFDYTIDEVEDLDVAIILADKHFSNYINTFVYNDKGWCLYHRER